MKNLKTFIVICAMMMSPSALAADKNWYGGFLGGLVTINGLKAACAEANIPCEDSGGAFQGALGYYLNENMSIDFGAGFGTVDIVSINGVKVSADMTTIGLGVTGYWPIGDQFSLYGKGGVHTWNIDVSSSLASASDDGTDLYLGLGVEFLFNDNLGLRTEYNRYFADGDDIDTATLGLVIHF